MNIFFSSCCCHTFHRFMPLSSVSLCLVIITERKNLDVSPRERGSKICRIHVSIIYLFFYFAFSSFFDCMYINKSTVFGRSDLGPLFMISLRSFFFLPRFFITMTQAAPDDYLVLNCSCIGSSIIPLFNV